MIYSKEQKNLRKKKNIKRTKRKRKDLKRRNTRVILLLRMKRRKERSLPQKKRAVQMSLIKKRRRKNIKSLRRQRMRSKKTNKKLICWKWIHNSLNPHKISYLLSIFLSMESPPSQFPLKISNRIYQTCLRVQVHLSSNNRWLINKTYSS